MPSLLEFDYPSCDVSLGIATLTDAEWKACLQMPALPRSHELLSANESRLLLIDMQERLLPVIQNQADIIGNCRKLITGAKVFNIPVTATEQYPKGLGLTVATLAVLLPHRIEKIEFSCSNSLAWPLAQDDPEDRFKVVVVGIEAHVCVQQTVLDLLSAGYRVYVAVDAVGSRHSLDRDIAIQRMGAAGATMTTTESVLFEWCERAGTPDFKQISKLVVDS